MQRDLSERIQNWIVGSHAINRFAVWCYRLLNAWFQRTPLRPLKLLANGTWLEHPLHPLLTDVPVGAWTIAVVLGFVALIFNVPNLGFAAALATGVGVLAALAAIAAGFMDWMDVDPPEKQVGMVHAILNITATLFFIFALVLLWRNHWAIEGTNVILLILGYLILTGGAFLGGDMVYRLGVMNNRNAYRRGPRDFTPALARDNLPENKLTRVEVKGQPILFLRRGEKIYAVGAVCSHYGAPLEQGKVMDETVQCPYHYSRFALADGSVREGPSTSPLPCYDTRVVDGQIQVKRRK